MLVSISKSTDVCSSGFTNSSCSLGLIPADHTSYAGNYTEETHGDQCKQIDGDHVLNVDGDYFIKVTGDCHLEVGG